MRQPASDTTSVGENIIFRPSTNWRKDAKEEVSDAGAMKNKLKDKQVKCRICSSDHFTAKCPFKGTMAPLGEEGAAVDVAAGHADAPEGPGGLGAGKSSYVPPHLRNGGAGAGDRMGGGKFERDDLATLRVTNVSCFLWVSSICSTDTMYRSQKWPRNKNFGICSSASVGSQESSWLRIGRPVWPKDLPSSVSRRGRMLLRHVRKWMAMVSST